MFKSWRSILALLLGMFALSTTSAPWPVVLAAPLVVYALCYAAGLAIVRHLRMRRRRKLLRGGFGHAIMWDFEPAWEALNGALHAYELTLDDFFSRQSLNRTVTPIIARYLTDMWVARGVLRQHGWSIPAGSESLTKVHAAATQAAMAMVLARALYFRTARR